MITLQFSANAINAIKEVISVIKIKDTIFGIYNDNQHKYIAIRNIHDQYRLLLFVEDNDIKFLRHNIDKTKYVVIDSVENKGIEFNTDIMITIMSMYNKSQDNINIEFHTHENDFQTITSYSDTVSQKYYAHFSIVSCQKHTKEQTIIHANILNNDLSDIMNMHYYIGNLTHTITENETYITVNNDKEILLTSTNGRCMIRTKIECTHIQYSNSEHASKIHIPFKLLISQKYTLKIYDNKTFICSHKYSMELPSFIEQYYLDNEYSTDITITISIDAIKQIAEFIKKIKIKGNNPANITLCFSAENIYVNIKDDIQNIDLHIKQEHNSNTYNINNNDNSFCICKDMIMMIYNATKFIQDENTIDISYDNEKTYGRIYIKQYNTSVFFVLNKQNYE